MVQYVLQMFFFQLLLLQGATQDDLHTKCGNSFTLNAFPDTSWAQTS